jgi:choice-of-anchor B domain-containing protein
MRNTLITALFCVACCSLSSAQTPSFENMTLLGHWDDDTLPLASPGGLNLQYSGVWGLAVNGREYAILGGAAAVLIFDVTNPTAPVLAKKFDSPFTTIWREFKTYKKRLYAVSDGTEEGLMIIDFTNAPAQINQTYYSDTIFQRSHTITLDTTSGHIYLNGGSSGNGITILDVSQTPDSPSLVVKIPDLAGGYIHDSYVRNDTLYASSGYAGYYVYDFKTDPLNPTTLANIGTGGYNHNSWITEDGRYGYYTEEIPKGRPIQIVDFQNLTATMPELDLVGTGFLDFLTPNSTQEAISHNVYIKDTILYNSQYEDGLLLYSISNPREPRLIGHYDTHPQNTTYTGYYGNWGNYPWLPSGTIIAGDMQNGLYLLKYTPGTSSSVKENNQLEGVHITPNPAHDQVTIAIDATTDLGGTWSYRLMTTQGQTITSAQKITDRQLVVPVAPLAAGLYYVEIRGANGRTSAHKLIRL